MKKNSLSTKGLSLSQATSISNLCNQRAEEIQNKIDKLNNYSKTITINEKELNTVNAVGMPTDIIDILKEKAQLHSCQAFLMENIKAKDELLKSLKNDQCDTSSIDLPEYPDYEQPKLLRGVDEQFGWSQLSISEINEYLEHESYASHIGQFIHKGGKLDKLRNELTTIPAIEWMEIETGKKIPVEIKLHNTPETLMSIHEQLATIHREHEQKVNYYKSKVKNIVTEENARIAKLNADELARVNNINAVLELDYNSKNKSVLDITQKMKNDFEIERQNKIKEAVSLRIQVDARFQPTIDKFITVEK